MSYRLLEHRLLVPGGRDVVEHDDRLALAQSVDLGFRHAGRTQQQTVAVLVGHAADERAFALVGIGDLLDERLPSMLRHLVADGIGQGGRILAAQLEHGHADDAALPPAQAARREVSGVVQRAGGPTHPPRGLLGDLGTAGQRIGGGRR